MHQVEQIDVLIVGSGPAGSSTALHLVRTDPSWAERIVVVDKAVHPREKLCGGGVTHLGENMLSRLGLALELKNFPIYEAKLIYDELSFSFFGNPVFRIIRRDEFDHWLIRTAEEWGVRVQQGEKVVEITPREEYVEVVTDKANFQAQVVVAADGSRSTIRQKLKWDDDSRVARLLEVLTPEDAQNTVEFENGVAVFEFSTLADGLQGYYWDFPSFVKSQAMMNRGVFDSRARPERPKVNLIGQLSQAMEKRDRQLDDYKLKGHPIRWFDKKGRFAVPRVILAGDAAGADPFMGEGISFALGYGEVAAQAIDAAFAEKQFSFADYRERILNHHLLSQLSTRVWLARFAYRIRSRWLIRLGWRAARVFMRFTRWQDPSFVPAEPPRPLPPISRQPDPL